MNNRLLTAALALLTGSLPLITATPASASEVVFIESKMLGPVCMRHNYWGDEEFNGNGPKVEMFFNLGWPNGKGDYSLWADMGEVGGDGTYGGTISTKHWTREPPAGTTKFTHTWTPDGNGVWKWVPVLTNGATYTRYLKYTDTDTDVDTFDINKWWLHKVASIGDTNGTDFAPSAYYCGFKAMIWFNTPDMYWLAQ